MVPPNIQIGKPDINMIAEKYQEKEILILNNELSDERRYQIND